MKVLGLLMCFIGGFLIGDVTLGYMFTGAWFFIGGFVLLGHEVIEAKNE